MKLYDWHPVPNPRRVRMFLHEKGLEMPIEEVGLPDMSLRKDFVARFDPYAIVPLLELDDGTCIGEGMAICRYLETLHPEPPLMGTDALDRATIEMWERRSYEGAMIAIGELLRNTTPAFVDRGLPGTATKITQIPELVERGKGRLRRYSESANERLADHRHLAGDAFTVADITAYCALDFLSRAVSAPIPDDLVHLRRWFDEVAARPSAVATL